MTDTIANILVVEDEPDIAQILVKFLQASGYNTKHVDNGLQVIDAVNQFKPNIVILDLMLPGQDGLTCCRQIRSFSDIPMIMLTAKVEEVDRLIGLEAGADDYVCKPFSAPELILRIKAILKRTQLPLPETSSEISLNEASYTIQYAEQLIKLTSVEFNLFKMLHDSPHRIYSREQIIEKVYQDYRIVSDRTVDSHIKNLRKKLKNLSANNDLIQSVYAAGYKYEPPTAEPA